MCHYLKFGKSPVNTYQFDASFIRDRILKILPVFSDRHPVFFCLIEIFLGTVVEQQLDCFIHFDWPIWAHGYPSVSPVILTTRYSSSSFTSPLSAFAFSMIFSCNCDGTTS